jgi:hypothetical protein
MRKIAFIFGVWLILMSSKCSQTKVLLQDAPDFKVFNAYTQKQIPGEQTQKTYVEFGFEVKGITDKITLDSVFCEVGKAVEIKTDGKNRLKLLVENQLITTGKFNKVIFYYSQHGSKYYYVFTNIKIKEDIYLP